MRSLLVFLSFNFCSVRRAISRASGLSEYTLVCLGMLLAPIWLHFDLDPFFFWDIHEALVTEAVRMFVGNLRKALERSLDSREGRKYLTPVFPLLWTIDGGRSCDECTSGPRYANSAAAADSSGTMRPPL